MEKSIRFITAAIAFLFSFAVGFVLGGLLLMPHLPPTPDHPVTVLELEYWTSDWAGAILGLVMGVISARTSWRHGRRPKVEGIAAEAGAEAGEKAAEPLPIKRSPRVPRDLAA